MQQSLNIIGSVALTAQVLCALLLAVTFAYVGRLFTWPYLRHWTRAWVALLLALLAVRAFIAVSGRGFWALYLVAEWVFLAQLAAGCSELASGEPRSLRRLLPALLAAAVAALALMPLLPDFNHLFIFQAAVLAVGYTSCLWVLGQVPRPRRAAGFHLMRGALGFLALLCAAYVPLYLLHGRRQRFAWLGYSSLADLSGQLLLGFGMLFVLSEEARHELSVAVAELALARDALELQARTDTLTGALNRFAFDSILEREGMLAGQGRGVLAMIDLDHLKEINDGAGHAAGDAALRAAAGAIRGLLGAHDLVFRWGGDEFLVLLREVTAAEAAGRLGPLGAGIPCAEAGAEALRLSWGLAEFGEGSSVQEAVDRADLLMYQRRAEARGGRPPC